MAEMQVPACSLASKDRIEAQRGCRLGDAGPERWRPETTDTQIPMHDAKNKKTHAQDHIDTNAHTHTQARPTDGRDGHTDGTIPPRTNPTARRPPQEPNHSWTS